MADLRDLFHRAAAEPHGDVSVEGLTRRAQRRRRARQRVGAMVVAVIVFTGVVAITSRSDKKVARVAIAPTTPKVAPEELLARTVTGVDPILLPRAIETDWSSRVNAAANTFDIVYSAPDGIRSVTLAVLVPDPTPVDGQSLPRFRGDEHSVYEVIDERDPGERRLIWTEPGQWAPEDRGGVPYTLSAVGLTEAEFWQIANSLHPIASSPPITSNTVPAGFDIGPVLDPEHLGSLPDRGIALQFGASNTVVLIALDGRGIGHLDGFDLFPRAISNPLLTSGGPLALGRATQTMVLQGAGNDRRLVAAPGAALALPLAGGAVLEPSMGRGATSTLRLADGSSIPVEFGALSVSVDRRWVTTRLVDVAQQGYSSGIAYDVLTGQRVQFDSDCFVAHDSAFGRVDVCHDMIGVNGLQIGKPGDIGHWTGAQISEDGSMLLAQFSGECEAQSAWFVPLAGIDHQPRLAGPPGTEWDSGGLGWLPDGRAVVSYGPGICGTALPNGPGVYTVTTTGELQPIYPVRADVQAWGALLWTNTP
jgi:hypothetical protein